MRTPRKLHRKPPRNTSLRLQDYLRPWFDARSRSRGEAYYQQGQIVIVDSRPGAVTAVAYGSREYEVVVTWKRGSFSGSCTCPAYRDLGPCKHLWGLILTMSEKGLGPDRCAAQLDVNFPENGDLSGFGEDDWEEDGDFDDFERTPPRHAAPRSSAVRPPDPWRDRLGGLPIPPENLQRNPWAAIEEKGFQIRYVIEKKETFSRAVVLLQSFLHTRRKGEEWSSGRVHAPELEHSFGPEDAVDRRVLALLHGGEVIQGYYNPAYYRERAAKWLLNQELCREVLPVLAQERRLYLRRKPATYAVPVEWDEGVPWTARIHLRREERTRKYLAEAVVERDGTRLDAAALDLFLPAGLLIHGGRMARLDAPRATPLLDHLLEHGPLRVPRKQAQALAAVLAGTAGESLVLPAELAWAEPAPPVPCLKVAGVKPDPVWNRQGPVHGGRKLDCHVEFDYGGGLCVTADAAAPILLRPTDDLLARRDFAAEEAALRAFLEAGGEHLAKDFQEGRTGAVTVKRLPQLVRSLLAQGWRIEAEGKLIRQPGPFQIVVRSSVDWFDLEGGMAFGEEIVSFPALLQAAREQQNLIALGDGSFGLLPEDWLAQWGLLELAGTPLGGAVRFQKHQGWLLDALLAERSGVEVDEAFARFRKGLARFHGIASKKESGSFRGKLRGYQREGLGWFEFLRQLGLGGCLADDMGLGKTVQVLALLEARRRDAGRPSLVVAPRSLVFNWIDEAARFTPELKVLDYTGLDRKTRLRESDAAHLVVTTYGTLRRDAAELRKQRFDYVILDEAQAIKNAACQTAKAARLLRGDQRLALSGTPIENHLGELWSLFEFLNPGMLGRSRSFAAFAGRNGANGAPRADLAHLARAVRPFFLRRTKEQVLRDLPPKTEQTLHCELSKKERRDYEALRDHYRVQLLGRAEELGLERMKIQVLEALLRLRQAACHPGLIDRKRAGESSAKLEALLPMLEEIAAEGHKALVFSQFTRFLGIVRERLDQLGVPYEYLDGRTRSRREKVARFQSDSGCPLFLISLKAGGHGLNLTAADYVFLLDPWWNPAVEAQAMDRAHRIGQQRPVNAYRIITRDSVEERVIELQARKRELAAAVLGEGTGVLKNLTREDLERLLS